MEVIFLFMSLRALCTAKQEYSDMAFSVFGGNNYEFRVCDVGDWKFGRLIKSFLRVPCFFWGESRLDG